MDDLIEALQILRKYKNVSSPLHCEHDTLYIMAVQREDVSDEDHQRLGELGFYCDEDGMYQSSRFGSS